MRLYSLFLVLLGGLFLFNMGCKSLKPDLAPPTLTLQKPNDLDTFYSTKYLPIEANLADNENLSEFSLQITPVTAENKSWDTLVTLTIYGQSTYLFFQVPIPDKVKSGNYQITAYATDAENLTSDTIRRNVYIKSLFDEQPPQFNISEPQLYSTITTFSSNTVVYFGEVFDTQALSDMNIALYNEATQKMLYQKGPIALNGITQYDFADFLKMPATTGTYRIVFSARDTMLNTTTAWVLVKVI